MLRKTANEGDSAPGPAACAWVKSPGRVPFRSRSMDARSASTLARVPLGTFQRAVFRFLMVVSRLASAGLSEARSNAAGGGVEGAAGGGDAGAAAAGSWA